MVSTSRDDSTCGSIVIVSYDMMTRCHDKLTAANFRVVIVVKIIALFFTHILSFVLL